MWWLHIWLLQYMVIAIYGFCIYGLQYMVIAYIWLLHIWLLHIHLLQHRIIPYMVILYVIVAYDFYISAWIIFFPFCLLYFFSSRKRRLRGKKWSSLQFLAHPQIKESPKNSDSQIQRHPKGLAKNLVVLLRPRPKNKNSYEKPQETNLSAQQLLVLLLRKTKTTSLDR